MSSLWTAASAPDETGPGQREPGDATPSRHHCGMLNSLQARAPGAVFLGDPEDQDRPSGGPPISLSSPPLIQHICESHWDQGLIKACLLTFI